LKNIKYITLLFILFLIIIGYIVLNLPMFDITNIIIKGNNLLSQNDIVTYSNIKMGENIFKVNLKEVKKNLLRNPRIEETSMKRVFPSTIFISVSERNDFAALYFLGSFVKIDKEGIVLEVKQDMDNTSILIITGIEIVDCTPNERVKLKDNNQLDAIIEIVFFMDKYELKDLVSEINIEDINDIRIYFIKGIEARVSRNSDIEEKIYMLKNIIIDIIKNNRGQGYIEMRGVKDPVFYPITK